MKKVMHETRWPQTQFLVLLALCTLGAFGAEDGETVTYRWNKTGYTDFSNSSAFTNATHWVDGKVPFDDAQGVVDLVPDFSGMEDKDAEANYYSFQWLRWPSMDLTWGSVASNLPHQYLVFPNPKWMLNITDPSGYTSLWAMRGKNGGLRLTNDGGLDAGDGSKRTPVIHSFENGFLGVIETSGDTTKVEVENLAAHGIFAKKGAGELVVSRPVLVDAWCSLYAGTLTLGRPDAVVKTVPESLAAEAVVHFDAARADKLETTPGEDGRLYVTNWHQVSGTGYASQCSEGGTVFGYPFVTTNAVSGLPLVDFGGVRRFLNGELVYLAGELEKLGPAAMLSIKGGCKDIKELFIVMELSTFAFKLPSGNDVQVAPFGGNSQYYWKLNCNAVGDNLYEGQTSDKYHYELHVDGVRKHTRGTPVTRRLAVYSFRFKTPIKFSWLGGYYTGGAHYGGVRIGEFAAYDRELTDAERADNVAFLKRKWQTGSDGQVWDMGGVTIYDNNSSINVEAGKVARIKNILTSSKVVEETNTANLTKVTKKGAGELGIEIITDNTSIHVEGGSVNFTKKDASVVETDRPAVHPYIHLDATVRESLTFDADNYVTEWKDCRADYRTQSKVMSFKAKPDATVEVTKTTYTTEGPDGMAVVDFGAYNSNNNGSSGFWLYENDAIKSSGEIPALEVFIVAKRYDDGLRAVFSSSQWVFMSGIESLFASENANSIVNGALFTMNGRYVKGTSGFTVASKDGFNIYSVQGVAKIAIDRLGGGTEKRGGGIVVGEYLIYDRKLSDVERANTIAYLMNKWKVDATMPEMKPTKVGTVTFAENVAPVIGNEGTCEIAAVQATTADSVFTKKGAGALTVNALSNVAGLNIEGGVLKLTAPVTLSTLSVPGSVFAAETPKPALEVDGAVALASSGTISLAIPDGFEPNSVAYPIAKATSFSGAANLNAWVKDMGDYAKGHLTLFVKDNVLSVRISNSGTLILIK